MRNVTTFAILLNGDFADSTDITQDVMGEMASAIHQRPSGWPKAKVILQISFDEFHQEVVVDRKGELKERIPVTKIANIVETAPQFSNEIQLCLLHKQVHLNFSMALFQKGVFARLVKELARRGHKVEIISTGSSPRLKRNPLHQRRHLYSKQTPRNTSATHQHHHRCLWSCQYDGATRNR